MCAVCRQNQTTAMRDPNLQPKHSKMRRLPVVIHTCALKKFYGVAVIWGPTNGEIPRDNRLIKSTQSPPRSLVRNKKKTIPTYERQSHRSRKYAAADPAPGSGHYKHHKIRNDAGTQPAPPITWDRSRYKRNWTDRKQERGQRGSPGTDPRARSAAWSLR